MAYLMNVVFLGTSGGVPSKHRHTTTMAVRLEGETLLFDACEGAQMQAMKAKLSLYKCEALFLSHIHADHFLGLPGIFQTLSLFGRKHKLTVFGPPGTKEIVNKLLLLGEYEQTFEVKVKEIRGEKTIYEKDSFLVRTFELDHVIECLGYVLEEKHQRKINEKKAEKLGIPKGKLWGTLQTGKAIKLKGKTIRPEDVLLKKEPGKKIVYATDTRPIKETIKQAKNADLLVHDSTLAEKMSSRAVTAKHSTAGEAGEVAKKANVKRLALIHVSARYHDDIQILELEARKEFNESFVPEDLEEVEI
ncbi:MAG: ribonuclease Z [Candidatus Diapherotrites archaeon]|nr:ribonuclease Z [Candidatus Diapherotrites archaeon]